MAAFSLSLAYILFHIGWRVISPFAVDVSFEASRAKNAMGESAFDVTTTVVAPSFDLLPVSLVRVSVVDIPIVSLLSPSYNKKEQVAAKQDVQQLLTELGWELNALNGMGKTDLSVRHVIVRRIFGRKELVGPIGDGKLLATVDPPIDQVYRFRSSGSLKSNERAFLLVTLVYRGNKVVAGDLTVVRSR